ncbi:hypothetical protein ACLOJK_017299 [Asimina triloba]
MMDHQSHEEAVFDIFDATTRCSLLSLKTNQLAPTSKQVIAPIPNRARSEKIGLNCKILYSQFMVQAMQMLENRIIICSLLYLYAKRISRFKLDPAVTIPIPVVVNTSDHDPNNRAINKSDCNPHFLVLKSIKES